MAQRTAVEQKLRNEIAKMSEPPAAFDWNDLIYFLAIARSGSVLGAAKLLRVSQSTVHRRMRELESRFGRSLLKTDPTGSRLTEFGCGMLAHAERVEDAITALQRHAAATGKDLGGIVRITCPESLGYRLMRSDLLEQFAAIYPGIKLEFVMSDRSLDLGKGEADIAIRAAPIEDESLIGRKIADSPWAVYASQSYVEAHGGIERAEDMSHHAVVAFAGAMSAHHAAQWLRSVAPHARVAARAHSLPTLLLAAKSGTGIAVLPIAVGDDESDLVRVFGPLHDVVTPFYLLMHRDLKETPRVRAVFDFVVRELATIRPMLAGREDRVRP
ncbi:MAG TPA: LysR family transcriptional regulator [Stellaceae bacterium]|jgi:DNA-binding transcriptional LysR family regulator|nr:LysR family transcriptional regulator [Stellaceae bacterium]